jgi:hypothetical protein
MLYKDYTKDLIGFKDLTVTLVERKDSCLHIHMMMNRKVHNCPRCGKPTDKIHDYRTQQIKDYIFIWQLYFHTFEEATLCLSLLQ